MCVHVFIGSVSVPRSCFGFFCRLGIAFQEEMCDIDIEVKVVKFGDVIVEVENIKDQLANLRYMANIS